MTVTFVTVPDCPLSEHGRHVLDRLADAGLLAWREVPFDSHGHARSDWLPLLVDERGAVLAHGRLSEKRLRRQLARRM